MKTIIKRYIKKFGYSPTISELYDLYTQGMLKLSDRDENELIKKYNQQVKFTKKLYNLKNMEL